jgi:hypothetical protein
MDWLAEDLFEGELRGLKRVRMELNPVPVTMVSGFLGTGNAQQRLEYL